MMHCEEFEVLLADSLDGALTPEQNAAFRNHLAACPACAAMAVDVRTALNFMERAAVVEPPRDLADRILHATNSGWEFRLRAKGLRGLVNRTFAPVLRPRLVMGAMLTLMSLTMLTRCAGTKSTLTAADLDPVRLWSSLDDRTHRLWDRTMKSYESLRVVYEIRTQLGEWKQQQAEEEEAAADSKANSRKLGTGQTVSPVVQGEKKQ